ncbi:MAG TPA: class I SAM-dependent methyltransferase [Actinomycetota bacterium]|nr:class I SAM-dependent methyltransferase [Actinomycetota bacterium]
MKPLPDVVTKALAFTRAGLSRPSEVPARIRARIESGGSGGPGGRYEAVGGGVALVRLHELLGAPYPCQGCDGFEQVWAAVRARVTGRAAGVEPHDADRLLALLVWTATRHVRPQAVVETGVARGLTTACILAALEANGTGRLWSIDLPPIAARWRTETGSAVSDTGRERWTYVRGPSRSRLKQVLREAGPVGVFVHDSLHTAPNMRFEFECAWPPLVRGGVLIADDIDDNDAFGRFFSSAPEVAGWLAVKEADKDAIAGIAVKTASRPDGGA